MRADDFISRTRAIERLKLNFPISQGADNSRDRHRYMQALADIQAIRELPSVTPRLSSELEKNSKKLEKDFGELDCISREQAIEGVWEIELAGLDNKKVVDMLKALPSVTPQEPKIKVLDYDEVARKLGTVDIYKASAWITLLKDLEYLGLKICEVKK